MNNDLEKKNILKPEIEGEKSLLERTHYIPERGMKFVQMAYEDGNLGEMVSHIVSYNVPVEQEILSKVYSLIEQEVTKPGVERPLQDLAYVFKQLRLPEEGMQAYILDALNFQLQEGNRSDVSNLLREFKNHLTAEQIEEYRKNAEEKHKRKVEEYMRNS